MSEPKIIEDKEIEFESHDIHEFLARDIERWIRVRGQDIERLERFEQIHIKKFKPFKRFKQFKKFKPFLTTCPPLLKE